MAEKQLIVAVEGTAALGPYWPTIVTDYLDKIIRCFCGNELNGQKLSGQTPELALVVFNTHGPYSAFMVQRSGWTKDMDAFLHWLSGIPFGGGGFSEAVIAEGLAEALMMFPVSLNGNQNHQNLDVQKHCILVAASNPHPLPTPVYRPPITGSEHNEKAEGQTETCLADAETVAKSFGLCFVSLSVISPKQLPKLRSIYNAAKRSPRAADPTVDHVKNPQYLVLLSDNFMEARAALSRPLTGSMTKLDGAPTALVQGPPTTSISSVNGSMGNRQQIGNIPAATVKLEPATVPSMVSGPAYSQLSSVSNVVSQGVPSLQTSSPSPTSQEVNASSETAHENKPLVNPQQSIRPIGSAPANVSILNNLSHQHRQMVNSASIAGASSIGLQTMGGTSMAAHMSNMISSGMSSAMAGTTSVPGSGALMATSQLGQNTALGSFSSTSSNISGNSNIGISSAMGNLQGNTGMGSLSSSGQLGQGGIGMNQNIMNNLGATSISSGAGTMMPTPGMSQQGGVNSLGLNNNSTINMPMAPLASGVQQSHQKSQKSDKVHLIDLRRANNTEIMLTKIKMPLPDMMGAALALDDSLLDADQVENLIKFCPTKEEMELLKGYTGNKETLGKCEQFFMELMKVPRVESKLRVFSFKIQFSTQIKDIRQSLNIVNSACEQIRSSDKLKEIMKKILYLGNTLNQGTARGAAVGFRLDSLLKLTDTRATNNKMTLMHYLCKVLASKSSDLLDFHEELTSLEAASKIQLKLLAEEQQAIVKGLEKVELELSASERDGPVSEIFCKTLKEFTAIAGADVGSITTLYTSASKNADGLAVYFGEDPARCPFEQVPAVPFCARCFS